MAKILANLFSSVETRLVRARQGYDWVKAELDTLEMVYNAKKAEKLAALARKLNKSLTKSAFLACDKEEYAQAQFDEALQKYDVKQYMAHRANNHGCARKIFAAMKKGESYEQALLEQEATLEKIRRKRAEFIAKLEEKKQAFLKKHDVTDDSEYLVKKAECEVAYDAREEELTAFYELKIAQKRAKLEAKLEKYAGKITKLTAQLPTSIELPEGVLLSVRNLKMYFGGLKAVDDLTFDVKKGEIFGLIGPNGAGKTTVFNCITRFYNATGGDVYFENKSGEVVDMRRFKVHDVILQGISRTFQNVELVKEISVLENLLVACTREYRGGLFVHALGLPSVKKEESLLKLRAMKILKFMGIENYAGWLAMGLPYGILKKVEIARALMSNAKLIIMDEPAAGLNDSETAELTETIRRIRDEFNVTILLVEHDMKLVMSVCDTICAISFGQMLAIGTPEEIQSNKAVQEAYLGVADEEENV